MAGPLTWRNVEAPDFRGSVDALQLAAGLLDKGLGDAKSTFKNIERDQNAAIENQFAADVSRFQDPEQLTKALQDGSLIAPYGGKLSADTINKVATDRVTSLLDAKTKTNDLAYTELTRGWTKEDHDAVTEAAPYISQASLLSRAGDQKGADTLLGSDAAKAAMSRVRPETLHALLNGQLSLASIRQGYDQTGTNFANAQQDRTENRDAQILSDNIIAESGAVGADDVVSYIAQNREALIQKYGAMTVSLAQRRALGDPTLKPLGYDWSQDAGGAGVAGVPVDIGTLTDDHKAVAQTLSGGGLSAPVVAGFLGNFHVEGGWNGAQGDGGSADGIAQWRGDRRQNFVNMFGKDPSKASKIDQAKFVLWELNNPEKAGMKPEDAARIKAAKTPEEAAQLIDALYERSSGEHRSQRIGAATTIADLLAGRTATNTTLKQNISGDPNIELGRTFLEKWSDKSVPKAVAQQLAGKGGVFEGENPNYLTTKIQDVMQRYHTNAAVAGEILARATNGGKSSWNPDTWGINPFGSGIKASFNERLIDELGKTYSNPDALRASVLSMERQANGIAANDQAAAQLSASTRGAAAKADRAARLGRKPNMSYELGKAAGAAENLQSSVIDAAGRGIEGQGRRNPPATPAVAPSPKKAQPPVATAAVSAKIAAAAANKGAENPAVNINRQLDQVRAAARAVKDGETKGLAPIWQLGREAKLRKTVNEAVTLAIQSGMPQFVIKKGESGMAHRERVKKLLKLQ